MTNINENFNFQKYDVGGNEATANDGKLTGEEARNARADGYTVWDGYTEKDGTPIKIEMSLVSKIREILKNKDDMKSRLDGINLSKLQNINLDRLFGPKVDGKNIDDVIDELTGKNDDKLTPEQKEARAELDKKEASTGMTYAQAKAKVAEILDKYRDCYDEIPCNYMDSDKIGIRTLSYNTSKQKVFNPDKLPEPAKTEYKEARAVMAEIENNNSALCRKGDVDITEMPDAPLNFDLNNLPSNDLPDGLGFGKIGLTPAEPTESQKEARANLDTKVSSTGLSYKDAKAIIDNLTQKYKNNPEYQSMFTPTFQGANGVTMAIRGWFITFDPYKLKGDEFKQYFEALNAIQEIETTNYALLVKAGLERTPMPENNMERPIENFEKYNSSSNPDLNIYQNNENNIPDGLLYRGEKIRPELL